MGAIWTQTPKGWGAACLDCQSSNGDVLDLGAYTLEGEAFAAAFSHDLVHSRRLV